MYNHLDKYKITPEDWANLLESDSKPKGFKFGITLGDNDFSERTILPFVELLTIHRRWDLGYPTKDDLIELFNRSATGIYWTAQNGLQYARNERDLIQNYLRNPKIYMNEALDHELETVDQWGNSDMVILDLSNSYYPRLYIV